MRLLARLSMVFGDIKISHVLWNLFKFHEEVICLSNILLAAEYLISHVMLEVPFKTNPEPEES